MSHNIGVFHPSFDVVRILRKQMQRYLPANIHQLISGRMFISLTRVSDWENVLVSEFRSKEEVMDVSSLSVCVSADQKGCLVLAVTQRGLSQATCPIS